MQFSNSIWFFFHFESIWCAIQYWRVCVFFSFVRWFGLCVCVCEFIVRNVLFDFWAHQRKYNRRTQLESQILHAQPYLNFAYPVNCSRCLTFYMLDMYRIPFPLAGSSYTNHWLWYKSRSANSLCPCTCDHILRDKKNTNRTETESHGEKDMPF